MGLHSKEENINVPFAPMAGHKGFPYFWVNRNDLILRYCLLNLHVHLNISTLVTQF